MRLRGQTLKAQQRLHHPTRQAIRVYSLEVPGSPRESAGLNPYPRTSSKKGDSARTETTIQHVLIIYK